MNRKIYLFLAVVLIFGVGIGTGYFATVHYLHRPSRMAMEGQGAGKEEMEDKAESQLFTCPMHPFIITEDPGACPICGMALVPVKGDSGGAPDEDAIKIDSVVRQNMGVRTGFPRSDRLEKVIRTVGQVTYDETKISSVNTKIPGWIEKLHVDQTGQLVKEGEPLIEIYSPELVSAQRELLIAIKHREEVKDSPFRDVVSGATALVEAARERLMLWDVSEVEIAKLEQSGSVRKTLTLNSPASGVVVLKNAFLGTYVMRGAELYRIADISRVWVDADVYEFELPWVKKGQKATVTLDYIPGKMFRGTVSYIYPYVDEKTKTIKVRVEIPNPGLYLKPDMFAHVDIESVLGEGALMIPTEAVIRTGVRNIVFVERDEGTFVPREVKLGVDTGNGSVQVLEGLDGGDRIVLSGQFMLDSESSIREAIRKMTAGGGEGSMEGTGHAGHQH